MLLNIKAQPAASRSECVGLYGEEALKIRLKAPAVEGAANKELIRFLAKSFRVAKSDIVIVWGQSSKSKRVKFPLTEAFENFLKEISNDRSI